MQLTVFAFVYYLFVVSVVCANHPVRPGCLPEGSTYIRNSVTMLVLSGGEGSHFLLTC